MLSSRRRRRDASESPVTEIRVRGGYHPDTVYGRVGEVVRLRFRREETAACSERVVFPAFGKSAMLPAFQDVTVELLPERAGAYELVRQEVAKGHQVFVICPLVEASEAIEAKAAVEEAARLRRDVFPELRIATLHGRMKSREKDAVMTGFRDRQYDVLVSTSVIEVGIDVPNATVMLIEGADRFGLAQLHQFRGRVGRGGGQKLATFVHATGASKGLWARISGLRSEAAGEGEGQKGGDMGRGRVRGPGFMGDGFVLRSECVRLYIFRFSSVAEGEAHFQGKSGEVFLGRRSGGD